MSDPLEPSAEVQTFLQAGRVARMATVDRGGCPHIVPICYAYDGSRVYSAVDEKPKRGSPLELRRIVNIGGNPRICLIVDEYDEDWNRLRFVMIHGTAKITLAGAEHGHALDLLRKKYPQYRTMALAENRNPVIAMTPTKIVSWGKF
jgi:PPOX class probable F420-dependent enzyme